MLTTSGTLKGERKGLTAMVEGAVEKRTVAYKYVLVKNVIVVACGGACGF